MNSTLSLTLPRRGRGKDTLIVAHRGASRLEPENTLAAFQKAIELGSDAIELDVRKTKDGVLAVFHDPAVSLKPICTLTFEELNQLLAKGEFQAPTLEQILRLASGKAKVFIEIKGEGFELEVLELALAILQPQEFFIISFHFKSLEVVKNKYPQIKLGWLIFSEILFFLLNKKKIFEVIDFFSINYGLWKIGFAKIIPDQFPVMVWTVDGSSKIKALLKDPKVQAIFTNRPDLALKLRNEYEPQ